jgi:hypothetical protein
MSLNAASGFFQNAGFTIPEIWSTKLNVEFYEASVLAAISNTAYEGEIKEYGDKVQIRSLPSISTYAYTKGQDLQVQVPETPKQTLDIDKGRYFNIFVDRVDRLQSDIDLFGKWTAHAGERLSRDVERYDVFPNIIGQADSTLQGNSAGKISQNIRLGALGAPANHVGITSGASGTANKRNVLEFIVDCAVALGENDVPRDGERFMVIPEWMAGMIRKSDLKDASLSGDNTSILRTGRLGVIDGFELYQSNMLYTVTDSANVVTYIHFGHRAGLTFANQLLENEMIKSERTFGSFARGLDVFGFKVIKSQAFGRAIVRPSIGADS